MSEIKTIKTLIPEDVRFEVIDRIVEEEYGNKKLMDSLTLKFKEKGFQLRLATALLGGDKQWSDIPELVQVAFIEGAKESLEWEILDANKWFTNDVLATYDTTINETQNIDSILFKNAIKIDDFNYLLYWDLKSIYNSYNNDLIIYNYETQREPEYKTIGTRKKPIMTYSLNPKAVEEIARDIISGEYEEDMLIYNVLLKNQKITPQVDIKDTKQPGIVNIEVVPNYERDSKNYTIVNPLDGWHRTMAGVRAYGIALKQGVELKRGYPTKLVMRNLKGAKHIVDQIFKRNDTSRQWTHDLASTDYNEFIELLIDSSKILKGNVVKTYEQYMAVSGSLTYSYILSMTVERFTTIEVNNKLQRKMVSESIANIIDMIFEYLLMKYGNMEDLMKKTHLVEPNIFVGYLAIAEQLREFEGDYESYVIKIGEKLCSLTEEELKPLKLTYKTFNSQELYQFFEKIAKGVIKNAK